MFSRPPYFSVLVCCFTIVSSSSGFCDDAVAPELLAQCEEYETDGITGARMGGYGSAFKFSQREDSDIGIYVSYSASSGVSLTKVLRAVLHVVDEYQDDGLVAKCFLGSDNPQGEVAFKFLVNGYSVPESPQLLNATEFVSHRKEAAVEAVLVRRAGIKGQCEYLLQGCSE